MKEISNNDIENIYLNRSVNAFLAEAKMFKKRDEAFCSKFLIDLTPSEIDLLPKISSTHGDYICFINHIAIVGVPYEQDINGFLIKHKKAICYACNEIATASVTAYTGHSYFFCDEHKNNTGLRLQ